MWCDFKRFLSPESIGIVVEREAKPVDLAGGEEERSK